MGFTLVLMVTWLSLCQMLRENLRVDSHSFELVIKSFGNRIWCWWELRLVTTIHVLNKVFLNSLDEEIQICQVVHLLMARASLVLRLRLGSRNLRRFSLLLVSFRRTWMILLLASSSTIFTSVVMELILLVSMCLLEKFALIRIV